MNMGWRFRFGRRVWLPMLIGIRDGRRTGYSKTALIKTFNLATWTQEISQHVLILQFRSLRGQNGKRTKTKTSSHT
jgi:hypothetical protein